MFAINRSILPRKNNSNYNPNRNEGELTMKKLNLLLLSLTLIAFLSAGLFQPANAQGKAPQKDVKRMSAMMHTNRNMPMGQHQPKGHKGGMGMMQMGHDPVFGMLHTYGCPGFLLKNSAQLGLTEKQTETLKTLMLEFKKTAVKNNADVKIALVDIKEVMNSAQPDFGKVKSLINKISSLKQQLRLSFLETLIQGRKALTPEQLNKLQSLTDKCGMGGHGMMQMMPMMK